MIRRGTQELRLLIAIIVLTICLVGLLIGLGASVSGSPVSTAGTKAVVEHTSPITLHVTFTVAATGY